MTRRGPTLRRAAIAGFAASTAYLAMQAADRRLAPNEHDDLLLWGGLLSRRTRRQRVLGLLVHYLLGTVLAAAYRFFLPVMPRLPGWLRGLLFVQAENLLLYPGVPLIEAMHPEIRTGKLPSLLGWRYFWVEAARHVAFGAVLGALVREEGVLGRRAE